MGSAELRRRREALHLSQTALAHALGITRNTVARWERGELEIAHAELVGIALDYLEARSLAAHAESGCSIPPNNLPEELTSLVGREKELADLRGLLTTTRLLTLVGIGGVGKTRLATRLASDTVLDYPDGVWFVDLSPVTQAGSVARAVMATTEFSDGPAGALATPAAALAKQHGLLVLDNCEHLLTECADFVADVLRYGNGLRILATSREPLRLRAERLYRVHPLTVKDPGRQGSTEELLELPSVRLLLDRATGQSAEINISADARALAEICWRLDGIPLALELAAARLTVLGAGQMASGLRQGAGLLATGPRDAPARQYTLRATLAWSHALMSGAEQRLFARLAVFAGGWTLEACGAVTGFDGIQAGSVVELLSQLVAKSLVVTEPGPDGKVRYRFLETVRQYAWEQLDLRGERNEIGARHTDWYLSWVQRITATGLRPLRAAGVIALVGADIDNVRRALDAATHDPTRIDRGILAAGRLWWYWFDCGRAVEGYQYTRELLSCAGDAVSPAVRAEALAGTGLLAWHLSIGNFDDARQLLEEAVAIQRTLDDNRVLAHFVACLARPVRDQGDRTTARRLFEEALQLAELSGNRQTMARSYDGLGGLLHEQGDFERAITHFTLSLQLTREMGDDFGSTTELGALAIATYQQSATAQCLAYVREWLVIRRAVGAHAYLPGEVTLLAGLAARLGHAEAAARLSGAASSLARQVDGHGRQGWATNTFTLIQRDINRARTRIGAAAFARGFAAGGTLHPVDAVTEALNVVDALDRGLQDGELREPSLTRREAEIAGLVARGMTNRQIAAELVLSESTAAKHVEHIREKLGFTSRAQIAAFAASSA